MNEVPTMVGSIVVVGALTCCALNHSVCDLKVVKMNVKRSRIHELMFYLFELSHNAVEETKIISFPSDESAVNHCAVIRWFKKFYLDEQA